MPKFEALTERQKAKVLAIALAKEVPIAAVIAAIQTKALYKFTGAKNGLKSN